MKKLKLFEIIEINDNGTGKTLLIESLLSYKNSLLTYYNDYFTSEPVLMVTSVFNACQYGLIVPINEFQEALEDYLDSAEIKDSEEREQERELINFQSIMLKDL